MEIDQFEEGPHLCYLKALEAQGKAAAALEHYNYASELFYREMGVQLSDEIQEVYRRISDGFNDAQTDLQSVKRVMLGKRRCGTVPIAAIMRCSATFTESRQGPRYAPGRSALSV